MTASIRTLIPSLIALACRSVLLLACGMVAAGLLLLGLRVPAIGWAGLLYAAWRRYRHQPARDSHGSAEIASPVQMQRGGLLAEDGLILGRCLDDAPSLKEGFMALLSPSVPSEFACRMFLAAVFGRGWITDRLIRVNNHVHLMTCSPAGGGKGVGVLIPNLLSYTGNCVVIDPKGELFRATAEHRFREFGHRIIRLDPFGVCAEYGPSDTLNPLDFINHKADDFIDQVRDLADQIVIREDDEKDPHWNESAIANVTALGAFVCGAEPDPQKRNLGTMRALAASRGRYALAVKTMQDMDDACQGVIARLGGSLTWHEGEELASVQATLARHINFLDSPAVARNVASSSFDPIILRQARATVYLILPHDRLSSLSRLLRLQIGTIMRRTTRGTPTEANPVLWLLDEYAHVGHMQAIEDAVTLMRGMGVRLWFIFQSLGQIKTCFGEKAQVVIDNCGTQQFFAVNSYETAEYISKRIGDATIGTTSLNDSRGASTSSGVGQPENSSTNSSSGVTTSDMARRYFKEDEILRFDPGICVIFHKNLPASLGRLVRFFEAPEFRRRRFGYGPRGTARPRPLGLAAGLLSLITLAVCGIVTEVILGVPGVMPRAVGRAAARGQARPALVAAPDASPGRIVPDFRKRQGSSGYLIKIE